MFTLPAEPEARAPKDGYNDELFRVIHGFDMLLVMSGSTPSGELEHE